MTEPLPLAAVAAGTDVFIDANILVYALGRQSAECEAFLTRCAREDVVGVTLFDVVADVTHRLMVAEAMAKKLIHKENASLLKRKPDAVTGLTEYWAATRTVLDLNLLILGLDEAVTVGAQKEREQAGLLTRDSLIVACMRSLGLRSLATADRDFDRVEGIVAYGPTDLVAS